MNFTVPLDSKTSALFYFCHIHRYHIQSLLVFFISGMVGMMKVDNPVENANQLTQHFNVSQYYSDQSQFDEQCGTSEVKEILS